MRSLSEAMYEPGPGPATTHVLSKNKPGELSGVNVIDRVRSVTLEDSLSSKCDGSLVAPMQAQMPREDKPSMFFIHPYQKRTPQTAKIQ